MQTNFTHFRDHDEQLMKQLLSIFTTNVILVTFLKVVYKSE